MAVKKYFKRKTETGYEIVYFYNDASCVAETDNRKFITPGLLTKLGDLPTNATLESTYVKVADLPENFNQTFEDLDRYSHNHNNKALLDTYTQTEANIKDAVDKKHSHTNASVLNATTASFTTALETKLNGIPEGNTIALKSDITSVFRIRGSQSSSAGFSTLLSSSSVGDVWNISDGFTTDTNFVEGSGKTHTAGTNIVCIEESGTKKWDVLGGNLNGYALSTHNHDTTYAKKSHTHGNDDLTGIASWAKASTKPSYTYSEIGAAPSVHGHYFDDIITSSTNSTTLTSALNGKSSTSHHHNGTYVRIYDQASEPAGASVGDIWLSA